jgi:hypothetical protein
MCAASNDGAHEPRLVSRSYCIASGLALPPDLVFCEQSDPKFGRLLDQVFERVVSSAVIIRFGGEEGVNVFLDVLTSHTARHYGVCHSSYLFVENESLALKWSF